MAIPFYENEEQLQTQQHHVSQEIDQVDGPLITNQNITQNQSFHSSYNNEPQAENHHFNHDPITEEDLMAWKILALAMCKALKDHYQQNMSTQSPATTSTPAANTESSTAVIQILPNGQVKPQWQ
ncbi:uncharacterized protein skl [Calliphora vicina]|uniref:uncharacterized protein skl n=1 Tax=Calliphora vicina TaxID=7373 RepID=UPI00325B56A2